MRKIDYYAYRVRDEITGRWYRTRYKMDEATAAKRHPDGERLDYTREVREVLEPGDPTYGPNPIISRLTKREV